MSSDSPTGLPACSGALMGLSIIAVGLRFTARRQQKLPLLIDDWMAFVALVTYIGASISTFIVVSIKGLGYSSHSFTPEEAAAILKPSSQLQIAMDVFQTTSLACIKLSALFFYRRVLCVNGISTWFDTTTKISITIVMLWLVVFQFLTGFQCGAHISSTWDGTYLENCTLTFPWLYGLTISDFLLDVWILALPIPLIIRLHTSPAKKISILGIFLLAFVGLGASIAKMVILIQDELGGPIYFITHDELLTVTSYEFYVMMENGMSLVAVNLPSLWRLCTSVIPEKLVLSFHSMVWLFSMRGSRRAGHSSDRKMSNTDELMARRSASATSSDAEAQHYKTYAMHDLDSARNGEQKGDMSDDVIYRQDTIEVHRA